MPEAFLSYTRIDDEFHGGFITALRKQLELGVRVATGDGKFNVFQDKEGIALGERWLERIDRAVAEASVFIPMLTPSYLTSSFCRRELEGFLTRERRAGRSDLVLPIYFVEIQERDRVERWNSDDLARELFERQHCDWREYADEPIETPSTRRAIKALASAIAKVIDPKPKTPIELGVEDAVSDRMKESNDGVEEIPGDFNALKHLFDWQKVHHAVGTWAAYHSVPNPFDMGPKNFLRCLFDLGVPGGRRYELEYKDDKLIYQ
jgi:hypothetical protein